MATYYVDYEGGNDSNDGLSFANRKKTINSASTAGNAGDTIRVMGSLAPTSIGNATWNNVSPNITLASALTKNIDLGESGWTAAANVTATTSATRKQGSTSSSLAIAAAFTTGQVARKSFAAADFSAYKQVSFWIQTNLAIAASVVELRLCSDAAGTTTVNTIAIPALPNVNVWTAITVDTGGALGASIQSVVLQALSDPGTVTILLDDIIACKDSTSADSITLNSLISKNTGSEQWFSIASINDTALVLDSIPATTAGSSRGYYGTTQTVTTYKREPIKTDLSSAVTSAFIMQKTGTIANPTTVSGGWNRTDMSTQTLQSWFTGQNGAIEGLRTNAFSFFNLEYLYWVRYSNGVNFNSGNVINYTNGAGVSCSTQALTGTANNCKITNFQINNCQTGMTPTGSGWTLTNIDCHATLGNGISIGGALCIMTTSTAYYNVSRGLYFQGVGENISYAHLSDANGIEGVRNDSANNVMIAPNLTDSTPVQTGTVAFTRSQLRVQKFNGSVDDNRVYMDIGQITSVADANRRTLSGYAWKFAPSSSNASADYPLYLEGIKVACAANQAVSVSVWVKRTNTGLTARLFLRGGQIDGVSGDVSASASGSANVYEQLTITFTPTVAGVVDVQLQAYGGTTFIAYFDDMTISQT